MPGLKNLPDVIPIESEEQAKKFNRSHYHPLLVFCYKDVIKIQDDHGYLIPKSEWKIIKHQIDSYYKKYKLTDERVKEINEQMLKEFEEGMDRWNSSYKKTKEIKPEKGSIYILQLKNQPIYKIGRSSDPQERLKSLQNSIPFECVLLHTILSNDTHSDEQKLLDLFKNKRISISGFKKQEWFKLNKRDIRYLTNLNLTNQGDNDNS